MSVMVGDNFFDRLNMVYLLRMYGGSGNLRIALEQAVTDKRYTHSSVGNTANQIDIDCQK
jgi:hypothetical protein